MLPVMFYIHGGEFTHGSGNDFPGHQLAAWGQVVVVTVNYRYGEVRIEAQVQIRVQVQVKAQVHTFVEGELKPTQSTMTDERES